MVKAKDRDVESRKAFIIAEKARLGGRSHVLKVLELCVGEGEDTECGVVWYVQQREGRGGERQECGATSSGMCSRLDSCAFV
jgi:hypothetical protein